MIEFILTNRCAACGDCVTACPTDVIERGPDGRARIARQDDCQTCFMCELYCRVDAIYVAPECEAPMHADAAQIEAKGWLGELRRHSGWHEWKGRYPEEHWLMDEVFKRAAIENAELMRRAHTHP